jgi:integrase
MHSGQVLQLQRLGQDAVDYLHASKVLDRYVQKKALSSQATAMTYKTKLTGLGYFIFKQVGKKTSMDAFIETLKSGKVDPYEFLADYAMFLKKEMKVNNDDLRQKGKIARVFLRSAGVKIDLEEFKEQVVLPKKVQPELEPAEKSQIIDLLNGCKNQRLRTAILMCASLGCRIQEACGVRNNDVNLEKGTITFRGEITKTRVTRTRPMTAELIKQVKHWQAMKYRPHRTTVFGNKSMMVRPEKKEDDIMLAFWTMKRQPTPAFLADTLGNEFRELAAALNIPKKDGKYTVTFHRLRAYVFSVISGLGDTEFANWLIGHSNSTYYRRSEKDKREAFARIERYLTYLDILALEAKGLDQETRITEVQAENQDLRRELHKIYTILYRKGIIKDPQK